MRRFLPVIAFLALVTALAVLPSQKARSADFPCTLLYSSLLDSVNMHYENGGFYMTKMMAAFLPGESDYGKFDDRHLITEVCSADGTVCQTLEWNVTKKSGVWWKMRDNEGDPSMFIPDAGDYVLRFKAEGVLFYEFPFSVSKIEGGDVYNPETWWFLDGPWEEYGYLSCLSDDVSQRVKFATYFRSPKAEPESDVRPTPKIKFYRDGKLVAMFNEDPRTKLNRDKIWRSKSFDLSKLRASGGGWFCGTDMFGSDGKYSLQLFLDDQLYGRYDFQVAGGKFVPQGRQVREGGDYYPLRYIEGGSGEWWVKKTG